MRQVRCVAPPQLLLPERQSGLDEPARLRLRPGELSPVEQCQRELRRAAHSERTQRAPTTGHRRRRQAETSAGGTSQQPYRWSRAAARHDGAPDSRGRVPFYSEGMTSPRAGAARGLAIAPVKIDTKKMSHTQRLRVGPGSYLVNAAGDCTVCHTGSAGYLAGGVPQDCLDQAPHGHNPTRETCWRSSTSV